MCRLGGSVIAASDESFGFKERLIDSAEPTFVPGTYDLRGEVVDGWETRRHAGPAGEKPAMVAEQKQIDAVLSVRLEPGSRDGRAPASVRRKRPRRVAAPERKAARRAAR